MAKRRAACVVYFIQSGERGPVKIGVSTDVDKRLFQLQAGNPTQLHLIGTVPGDEALEEELHRRFADGALGREWFRGDTAGLAKLLAHVFQHGQMPEPQRDPVLEPQCAECGWAQELELADHPGEVRCWRCIARVQLSTLGTFFDSSQSSMRTGIGDGS